MKVLFEDNQIIVVVKEPGILSQADKSKRPDLLTNTKLYLKEKYSKPGNVFLGLVHRLDRNVGGVMVFAKTSKAAGRLNDNKMKKRYYAIVEGHFEKKVGRLVNYITKNEDDLKAYITDSNRGKEAILEYQVIAESIINGTVFSLVDIDLLTGRFHQIRCQFSYLGHPLYGDKKYGSKVESEDKIGLWAYSLSFIHPISKEEETFVYLPDHNPIWKMFSVK